MHRALTLGDETIARDADDLRTLVEARLPPVEGWNRLHRDREVEWVGADWIDGVRGAVVSIGPPRDGCPVAGSTALMRLLDLRPSDGRTGLGSLLAERTRRRT